MKAYIAHQNSEESSPIDAVGCNLEFQISKPSSQFASGLNSF
jgi:hypothetical protein